MDRVHQTGKKANGKYLESNWTKAKDV